MSIVPFKIVSSRAALTKRVSLLFSPALLLGAAMAGGAGEPPVSPAQTDYVKTMQPLLTQYCGKCHGEKGGAAGISLGAFPDVVAIQKDQTTWRKVVTRIRERTMPPPGTPQPPQEQRNLVSDWLTKTLDSADSSLLPKNPGRILIHRLSRQEYNNTVRDLFGVTSNPADKFPADGGGGGGFDNNADTLFVPSILMERYLTTAGDVLDEGSQQRLFFVRPGKTLTERAAAKKIVTRYATLAFRRPVEEAEIARLMRLFDKAKAAGDDFEAATKFALKGALVSPNFLFRVERDRPTTQAYSVSDYELASRLSYFLWASMPDDALFALAAQGQLHRPEVLDKQVKRMLQSPKSRAFSDSFAGQWLRARDLYSTAHPDGNQFKAYTPSLRDAMYAETIDFFDSIVREDASLLRLLDADYTYLNEELAKHYGVDGVTGPEMRRVKLADNNRGGVMTLGSVLVQTSYPLRTSPVLRGKWVLEQILGSPTPPPPPNVGTLPADDAPRQGLTFRHRLEEHRKNPACASCHNRLDPIGFGLENFDAIGRWRTQAAGSAVDASGVLPTGEKFTGPAELKKLMLQRKDEFLTNLTEKMLAYALGRGLEPYDLPTIRKITAAVKKDNYRSTTLISEITRSYPFQYRKNL
jgi:mono/diheme cytochrome c family protein